MAGIPHAARGVTALNLRADVLLAVLLMAALTYLCRAGGLVIRRAVRLPPFAESLLRELPGPLFVAYTAPALAAQGPAGVLAALAVAAVQWRTRNLGAAILAGVAAMAVLRLTTPL